MTWRYPSILLLFFLLIPFLFWLRHYQYRRKWALLFSSNALFANQKTPFIVHLYKQKELLWGLFFILLILALARPVEEIARFRRWDQGIDIVFILDISTSMLNEDLQPNRLDASKKLIRRFLNGHWQRNDRVALVLFAKKAATLCPLTTDKKLLKKMLFHVQSGILPDDTAIGDAIATALARLRHLPRQRKKAIILVTDGENNAGNIHPLLAAKLAQRMNVQIFPIFVGAQRENSPIRKLRPLKVLRSIARLTEGRVYVVHSNRHFLNSLKNILDKIAPSRRKKPKILKIYKERYHFFLWPAFLLLILIIFLDLIFWRSVTH